MSINLKKMKKVDLQKECKKAGLSTSGTIVDLKERLEALQFKRNEEKAGTKAKDVPTDQKAGTNRFSALVYEDVDVDPESSDDAGAEVCKEELQRVLDEEGLVVQHIGPKKVAGNQNGHLLFEMLEENRAIITELRTRLDNVQSVQADQSCSKVGYTRLRNRFISFYKRKVQKETEQDEKIITTSNQAAHGGDPFYDALLYEDGIRVDEEVFEELYGLDYKRVRLMRDQRTLALLADHALVISSDRHPAAQAYHDAFTEFIATFREDGFNENFHSNQTSSTYRAYYNYWTVRGNEVTIVQQN